VAPPLVLLGHGGSGHKRSDRIRDLAFWLVETAGLAAVAIDGPFHGERAQEPFTIPGYQARVAAEGAANVVERMISDWCATIELVDELWTRHHRQLRLSGVLDGHTLRIAACGCPR